ncbi:MAG TPA: ATPase inhibitor subunit zeta [Xanthobacteraceae bacterium]|jgi:hypothetical protein|nr:ATPase inhibitor subunit zeta [Xanthobacteraceae bacterium]
MAGFDDDLRKIIRRNKLLGMWAAEKLGLLEADATAYSDALAMDALDPQRSDVFNTIRKDFDAAGVVQSCEQILDVMNELSLKAADPTHATRGDGFDAVAVRIAKNLTSR